MNEAIFLYSEKSGRATLMEAKSRDSNDLLNILCSYNRAIEETAQITV